MLKFIFRLSFRRLCTIKITLISKLILCMIIKFFFDVALVEEISPKSVRYVTRCRPETIKIFRAFELNISKKVKFLNKLTC